MKKLLLVLLFIFLGLSYLIDGSIRDIVRVIAFDIFVAGYLYWKFKPVIPQYKWKESEAVIISSEVMCNEGDYYPQVNYSYQLCDVEYASDVLTELGLFKLYHTNESAAKLVKQYEVGKKIKIYVSPEDHSKAVIIPGVNWRWPVSFAVLCGTFTFLAFFPDIYKNILNAVASIFVLT
ncbi:DUF3592 domain-containing protein [Shewanella sp. A25]|nr:DUF3592 domain-containing protein [Shewanella shenzhenensis]